jgi:hypothetical protein
LRRAAREAGRSPVQPQTVPIVGVTTVTVLVPAIAWMMPENMTLIVYIA